MKEYLGCGSNSCYLEKPNGQGTNGPCQCLKELPTSKRIKVEKYLLNLKSLHDDEIKQNILQWRDITSNSLCPKCGGSGKRVYANTTTWRGGIGGQALTMDVCDECWGSGDISNKGFNLRKCKV